MCGITGFISNSHNVGEIHLKEAAAKLTHQHIGGLIFEQNEHFTIGLASQQVFTTDKQPFSSNCGKYSISLNGTIYNAVELRETLIKYGVIFNTLSDTEVLLACYMRWGHKVFEKIDGSYTFVILDRNLNQLFIARDTIGSKPLYYYKDKDFYAFASEIKALFSYPGINKHIHKNAVATYFRYGYFAGDETIYQQINRFKKGTITVIDLNSGNSYDAPILIPEINEKPTQEHLIIDRVEELLTESILKRNVANTSSGVLLDNGYDNSVLAAILQKNQSKRIKTFTLGFEDPQLNEASKAKKIAAHLKTNHTSFYFNQKHATALLEKMPDIFEEPMGDSSALSFLFIAKSIENEVKVLLGAESGNILFGGYHSYNKALKLEAFSKRIPSYLKPLSNTFLKYTSSKTQEVINAEHLLDRYQHLNACFTQQEITALTHHTVDHDFTRPKSNMALKDLVKDDFENYLPNSLLYKSDKCLMHYGIDNRDAFLKADLANYLLNLDQEWLIRGGQTKYLLKKIAHQYIPEALMDPQKRGHYIPLSSWLKTCFKPYIESYLTPDQLNQHQLLNVNEVLNIKAAFYANSSLKNAKKVWLLLQFQMWYQRWMA